MGDTYLTRDSLLFRVKEKGDNEAWAEFISLYQPFVNIFLRKLPIAKTHSEDIAQEIMVEIWNSIGKFDPEGSAKFRTWLISLIRNHAYQYMKKVYSNRNREARYAADHQQFTFDSEAIDSGQFDQLYQKEWEAYVSTLALKIVKDKFVGNAIKIFEMSLDGKSAAVIAEKLKIKHETVYQLRNRVKSALIKEIARLRQQLEL